MKKSLIYALAFIYIVISPIIVYLFLNLFMFNSFISFPLHCLFYVFIVINTLTVIKLIINNERYGVLANPFRKIREYTNNELIIAEINNLKSFNKTLIINNNLIVINESGIFEFATINKTGILKGDIHDSEWTINNKKIPNPFIIKEDIFHYFIINGGISFQVTGVWLTTRRFVYNTLEQRLNKKIYNPEQINKIYDEIKLKYSFNDVK